MGRVHTPVSPFNSLSHDSVLSAGANDDFFQLAHELDRVESLVFAVGAAEATEVKDRVANELARSVVSDVAAAIDFEELDAAALELFFR